MIWTKFDIYIKNIKKHAINPIVPPQTKKLIQLLDFKNKY